MDKIPQELFYVLVFLAIVIFNFLTQRAAQRKQQEAAQIEPPEQDAPLEEIFGRTSPAPVFHAEPASGRETRPPAPEPRRSRSSAKSLLRTKRDLQRAVVAMTVLGPCRALEAQNGQQASGRR